MVFQLEVWWVQQVDALGLEKGRIPPAANKVYERALLDVIGAWNTYRVYIPDAKKSNETEYWSLLCSRARIYCTHLDLSAKWLLDAISRNDEVAAIRHGDMFIKWWGTSKTELMPSVQGGYRRFDVGLSVIEMDWDAAKEKFWDERFPLGADLANRLVGSAIKDYWESLRLVLALVLLEKCSNSATKDSLEILMLKHLLSNAPFKDGGQVEGNDLRSRDSIWAAFLTTSFRDGATNRRVNAFIEQQRWDKAVPEVPGWSYMWSGSPSEIETRYLHLALLVSVFDGDATTPSSAKRVIEGRWRDTQTLQYVSSVLTSIGGAFATEGYESGLQKVNALRMALGFTAYSTQVRHDAKQQALALIQVANHERRLTLRCSPIAPKLIQDVGRFISKEAFEREGVAAQPFMGVQVLQKLGAPKYTFSVHFEKEQLQRLKLGIEKNHYLSHFADKVWEAARKNAISAYLKSAGVPIYPLEALTRTDTPVEADVTAVLRSLVADAEALRTAGDDPVVIASKTSFFDSPYGWTDALYGKALPSDIRLEQTRFPGRDSIYLQINGTPILDVDTGDRQCCVVPLSVFNTLYVEGDGPETAIKVTSSPLGDEHVALTFDFNVCLFKEPHA